MNLSQITLMTATEIALMDYAKRLEKENIELKLKAGLNPLEPIPTKEINLGFGLEKFWFQSLALAKIDAVRYGQEIIIKGRSKVGSEHFQVGVFVHENDARDTSFIARYIPKLMHKCLHQVAEIYKPRD